MPDSIVLSRALREGQILDGAELEALGSEVALAEALDAALSLSRLSSPKPDGASLHLRRKGHAEESGADGDCPMRGTGIHGRQGVRLVIRAGPDPISSFRPTSAESELRARGVGAADADAALDEAFRELAVSSSTCLRQSAVRRARALRSVERSAARRRLFGYLLRRGFAGADVRLVVDELLPESE